MKFFEAYKDDAAFSFHETTTHALKLAEFR